MHGKLPNFSGRTLHDSHSVDDIGRAVYQPWLGTPCNPAVDLHCPRHHREIQEQCVSAIFCYVSSVCCCAAENIRALLNWSMESCGG